MAKVREDGTFVDVWPEPDNSIGRAVAEDLKKELGVVSPSEHFDDSIEHLVDVTCSWHEDILRNGDRLYAIGPGFTREDLTPYELQLLEKSEAYRKRKDKE